MDRNDAVLIPLLDAESEHERERLVASIFADHANPIIDSVLRRFRSVRFALSAEDRDDVRSTVHVRLLQRLRTVFPPDGDTIERFEDYVATLTYRTVYDLQRRRFPERTRLKNRIRYLLTHDRRFDLWVADEGSVCGLRAHGRSGPRAITTITHVGQNRPADAIEAVLRKTGGPVTLDDLVGVLAVAWGVTDHPAPAAVSPPETAEDTFATREAMAALWREILLLPPNQRAALLLNLRDSKGGNALTFIHLLGLATFDELAAATTLTALELATVWSALPLDDQTIASRLGLTRQQVINLRKAARARLARRRDG